MTEKKTNHFPDPLAPDEEKATQMYGLQVAKAISQEWFNGGHISEGCDFFTRRSKIQQNRLYSRGWQQTDTYKKLLEDLNYMNVDWTPPNIAGKFVDIIVNGNREDLYRVDISAIDRVATLEREEYRKNLKKKMNTKDYYEMVNQVAGIDMRPTGFIPQDDEALEMHLSLDYKPKIEIAEELLIKYVQLTNDWEVLKRSVDRDLTENALGCLRIKTDKTNGVMIDLVNIENLIHSYVRRNDFKDCHYFGEVRQITINKLRQESGYDDYTLRKIAERYATQNGNKGNSIMDWDSVNMNEVLDFKIAVMDYTFKTSKQINYKKKFNKYGGYKMIKKNSSYNPPKRSDYAKKAKVLDTWYEGTHIINTDFIYDYKESEIIARDRLNRAMPSFICFSSDIYENRLHSVVERMQPIIEQMIRTHLKIQQIVAMMRPDETEIDIDLLAELSTKTGKKLDWEDAISLYNSKGIVISTRVDMGEEGMKDRPALRVPTQQQSGKLESLTRTWIFYYNMLRDITGINSSRDGSAPHDTLVGVNEMQIRQSNLATQGVREASMEITRKCAETISTRLGDIFRWGKDISQVYKNAVGAHNMDVIKALEDRHIHEFGFVIQIMPTEQEMMEFKESLNLGLKEGSIKVDDKIKAERIAKMSIKQAENFLTYRRKKNMEADQANRQAEYQAQAQSNSQVAQQAEQQRQQGLQLAMQLKIAEAKELAVIEVMKQNELNKVNKPKEERGYEVDIFIEQLKQTGQLSQKGLDNDKKDERQKMVATQNSKMIEQRKKDSGAIDFENSGDFDNPTNFFSRSA